MTNRTLVMSVLFLLGAAAGSGSTAQAQVSSLYYKEISKEGRIYVFNTPERFKSWSDSGDMGPSITLLGAGPNGETVVAENETAVDLFMFRHNLDGYDRPTPKPAAPAPPTSLKVVDGELKFSGLLQIWYVADDSASGSITASPAGDTDPWYGNNVGNNTFLIRRAELKLSGRINPSWGFEVMIDPAKKTYDTKANRDLKILQDIAVTYLGLKGHEFSIGQKKITITEEGLRSSSEIDFVERAHMTRRLSDRREAGLFYKGEWGRSVIGYASITNGSRTNVNDYSNDTLFGAARVDFKPKPNFFVGVSGGYGQRDDNGPTHLDTIVYGGHVRYDGTEALPLMLRAEYQTATTESAAPDPDVDAEGYYASALYTFAKRFRVGARYDVYDPKTNDATDSAVKTWTVGFHFLPKGKNLNFKFEWARTNEDGRQVNNQFDEEYNVGLVAAQAAF